MKKQRKRKKSADKKQVKRYARLSLTKRFFFYVALLAFAIVFTQTLQSKASNLFFWFVLLIPVVMLIYALSAGGAIRAYSTEEYTRVEKLEDVTYAVSYTHLFSGDSTDGFFVSNSVDNSVGNAARKL